MSRRLTTIALLSMTTALTSVAHASQTLRGELAETHYIAKSGEVLKQVSTHLDLKDGLLEVLNDLPGESVLTDGQLIYIPMGAKPVSVEVPSKPIRTQSVKAETQIPMAAPKIDRVEKTATLTAFEKASDNLETPSIVPTVTSQVKQPPLVSRTEKTAQLSEGMKAVLTTRMNPTSRDITLIVPLKDRQFFLGDVTLKIDTHDQLFVDFEDFQRVLKRQISPEKLSSLSSQVDEGGFIPVDAVNSTGLAMSYDQGLLELSVTIPSDLKTAQSFSITNLNREARGDFVEPEKFSFFTTMQASLDYLHTGPETGLEEPFVDFFSGGRIYNIAYENEAFYDGFNNRFLRRGSRLIYDDVKRALRYQAGDIRSITRGFQSPDDILGVSISRAYSTLQPLRSIRPRGDRTFVLDEPGFVEIEINGRPVRRLRLDAGTFDLSDFPFVSGSNDVRVIVENQAGRSEELAFNLFFDQSMLEVGTSEFSATLGVSAPLSSGEPDYDFDTPIFSGFYRRGMSDQLTLGGNLQAQENSALIGTEAIWSNEFGTFRPQFALSTNTVATDFAARLDVERQFSGQSNDSGVRDGRSRFILSLSYFGESYSDFGSLTPNNPFSFETGASFGWDLTPSMNATIGTNYNIGRGNQDDTYGGEFRLGWRLSGRTGINLSARYDKSNSFDGFSGFITLSRRLGERSSVRAAYDSRSDRSVLSYTRSSERNRGDWGANIDLEYADSEAALNADLNYIANRADIGLAHRATLNRDGDIADQRSSLRAATTFGFAGSSFSFARPGSGNFAIVKPHKTIKGKRVRLNPMDDGELTVSRFGLPAMTTEISSYSKSTIRYDVDDLPLGYDLGAGNFDIFAPLHAGYELTVGSNYSVSVIGTLMNDFDEPVAFLTGTATRIGASQADKTVRVFTNSAGRFGEAFAPGTWRLVMKTTPETVYEFTVPEDDAGIFRAGKLKPKTGR